MESYDIKDTQLAEGGRLVIPIEEYVQSKGFGRFGRYPQETFLSPVRSILKALSVEPLIVQDDDLLEQRLPRTGGRGNKAGREN